MSEIFTLDARDNIMLEFIEECTGFESDDMFFQINDLHEKLNDILEDKKIKYQDLKTCLIPSIEKQEVLFVFDSSKINNAWYGNEVFEQILPLFDKKTNHSILDGDLLGRNYNQNDLCRILKKSLSRIDNFDYKHSSQFYLVYINNMTQSTTNKFNNNLEKYIGYIGYVDLTYDSILKTLVSTMLINTFIKYKNLIIQSHEDGVSNTENHNLKGYNFEKYGFKNKSLESQYFDLFLSYKIERKVFKGFEKDLYFSLNVLSDSIINISECEIFIDEKKLGYLNEKKSNQFKKANLDISKETLTNLIKNKLFQNYIYNMRINEYDNMMFNLILEVQNERSEKIKMLVSLEYLPILKQLRLITMY
ncbi:hypothetical protein [Aliarcobacter butzleri]|uniref:hypothetical protein n=1 Tax=Aliarcobacter butzleri TaxID=28197 RepID=UPI00263CD015|nr:hypothetical protein [Aliarcobacter butzleri]MDN5091062.1 hypothetical protein [Aliarcobacter butzleri]